MFPNTVRRQAAGNLAGLVSAHAVADDEETQLRFHTEAILVVRSPSANIAFSADLDPHSFPIRRNSWGIPVSLPGDS
jgi:hypothetical protein